MSENKNMFAGVFIPREVLLDPDISASGKIIFAIIQSLDNDKGCFASNEYIGEMLGLSESSVRSSIADLERKKYIERVVAENNMRTIRTCTTASFAQPRQISGDLPTENLATPRQKTGTYKTKNINKNINTLMLPPLPHSEAFAKVWEDWMKYRAEMKKPLTPTTIKRQIEFLSQLNEHDATEAIIQSIKCGWSGIFANQRTNQRFQQSKPLTSSDHETF